MTRREHSPSDHPSRVGPVKQALRQVGQVSRFLTGNRLFIRNPFCVRPAPISFTATFREVLVCCRDHFAVDPAQWGFGAPRASKPFCAA